MIKTEHYMTRDDGLELIRTYSDREVRILKAGTNEVYDEAIDVEGAAYTYIETDQPIDKDTNEEV